MQNVEYFNLFLVITCLFSMIKSGHQQSYNNHRHHRHHHRYKNQNNFEINEDRLLTKRDQQSDSYFQDHIRNSDSISSSDSPTFIDSHLDPNNKKISQQNKNQKVIVNITTIIGQAATLPCQVKNLGIYQMLWLRIKDGDVIAFDNMLITQDSRFSIDKTTNESKLILKDVRLSDAGEYACQINTVPFKIKLFQLIILSN
jgi:hypothetical protein